MGYRILCHDARTLPAGGATELEIAKHLFEIAQQDTSLQCYVLEKFAEAFKVIPRTLAENSGLNTSQTLSSLWSAHIAGNSNVGLDLLDGKPKNLNQTNIVD